MWIRKEYPKYNEQVIILWVDEKNEAHVNIGYRSYRDKYGGHYWQISDSYMDRCSYYDPFDVYAWMPIPSADTEEVQRLILEHYPI